MAKGCRAAISVAFPSATGKTSVPAMSSGVLSRRLREGLGVGRLPNETSVRVMVINLLEGEGLKWYKVRMRAEDIV